MPDSTLDSSVQIAPFRANIKRIFLERFTAMDLADPLLSFDDRASAAQVKQALEAYISKLDD